MVNRHTAEAHLADVLGFIPMLKINFNIYKDHYTVNNAINRNMCSATQCQQHILSWASLMICSRLPNNPIVSLTKTGHTVANIWNIKQYGTKLPPSMFFVVLKPAPNNKDMDMY
jgi:hypothetical protein